MKGVGSMPEPQRDQEPPQESLTNEALGPRSTMDEAPTPSSAGWMASPPCQDAWAARYPLEVGTWGEHDCAYRKDFGHCASLAANCAATCGLCTLPMAPTPRPPTPPPPAPSPLRSSEFCKAITSGRSEPACGMLQPALQGPPQLEAGLVHLAVALSSWVCGATLLATFPGRVRSGQVIARAGVHATSFRLLPAPNEHSLLLFQSKPLPTAASYRFQLLVEPAHGATRHIWTKYCGGIVRGEASSETFASKAGDFPLKGSEQSVSVVEVVLRKVHRDAAVYKPFYLAKLVVGSLF